MSKITNSLTTAVTNFLNMNGFEVWRNNTVGIWDQQKKDIQEK